MIAGTAIAIHQNYTPTWEFAGITAYTALWTLALNLIVSGALTLVMRVMGATDEPDETTAADYDELVAQRQGSPPVAQAPAG
jgi:hypothetical protein